MKKITKMGIDALKSEFSVLNNSMMHDIIGGIGAYCVLDAINIAAQHMNACIDSDAVREKAIGIIKEANPGYTTTQAEFVLFRDGLNNSQASTLINSVLSSCECSSSSCPDNTTGLMLISYAQDDKKGGTVKENEIEVTHMGVFVGYTPDGKMKIQSNTGIAEVEVEYKRNCFFAWNINSGYERDCGSGDGGDSGSGSDSGSGGSGSGGDNYCGSGSGWY